MWGAVLGPAFLAIVVAAGAISSGSLAGFVGFAIVLPFVSLLGATVRARGRDGVGTALIVSGPNVRRHRTISRLVAAAVSAIPGALAVTSETAMAFSTRNGVILVGLAVATVVAAPALAPRVAVGKDAHDVPLDAAWA